MADFVKFFLIEDASIPKAVRFLVKFLLEIASEHQLYLTGKIFAVVESEEPQQMQLRRIQGVGGYVCHHQ